jgi:hypothetical protein
MSDIHQQILGIVGLGSVTPGDVASAIGVPLSKTKENPYTEFYEVCPVGLIEEATLKLSRTDLTWLVAWKYDANQMPREDELDLSRYGAIPKLALNPRIPPEGTFSYIYDYMGFKLFIQFTAIGKRLRGVALHKD